MKPIYYASYTFLVLCACGASDSTVSETQTGSLQAYASGQAFSFTVAPGVRSYVNLADKKAIDAPSDPAHSTTWDLAFEGLDVYTNGGVSGAGKGASFGPLESSAFAGDTVPAVPYLAVDKSGGAFLDWYKYEGAPAHALWSRYHIVGVRDGARLWKVQVLGYYGERDGAPIGALYKIRYAELQGGTSLPTQEVSNIDGTAGGTAGSPDTPSECLDLGTGARVALSPEAARNASNWHLCFRRQSIAINGEQGGPRGVQAVDLSADQKDVETVEQIRKRTAATELAAFDAVTSASYTGKSFRGDRVVSGFGDAWLNHGDNNAVPMPTQGTWIVLNAAGTQKYVLAFDRFDGATLNAPGSVRAYLKPLKDSL